MNTNQEIISRLKFIGKLKKGEKINTQYLYVQTDGWIASFSRTFLYRDNRGKALVLIKETISRAFELLITYKRSEIEADKVLYSLLVKDLTNAAIGLGNLKSTYVDDTKFCCDMDTLLEYVQAHLTNFPSNNIEVFSDSREEHESPNTPSTLL